MYSYAVTIQLAEWVVKGTACSAQAVCYVRGNNACDASHSAMDMLNEENDIPYNAMSVVAIARRAR